MHDSQGSQNLEFPEHARKNSPDIKYSKQLVRDFAKLSPVFEDALTEHMEDALEGYEIIPILYFTEIFGDLRDAAERNPQLFRRAVELLTNTWIAGPEYTRDTIHFGFLAAIEREDALYPQLSPTLREAYEKWRAHA